MAEHPEIIDQIEALAVHCRPPLMSVDHRSLWLRTWCEDLAEFPAEAIRVGCRSWRQGDSTKFPTPGQLLPLVRKAAAPQRAPAPERAPHPAWTPISDELYASLSLVDKAWNQGKMGQWCLGQAGPQPRDTPPDEMPEAWKAWRRRATDHFAEETRLKQLLAIHRGAAE